jgi:hypothetical protein
MKHNYTNASLKKLILTHLADSPLSVKIKAKFLNEVLGFKPADFVAAIKLLPFRFSGPQSACERSTLLPLVSSGFSSFQLVSNNLNCSSNVTSSGRKPYALKSFSAHFIVIFFFLLPLLLSQKILSAELNTSLSSITSPETTARAVCATCHAFPDPSLLPLHIWTNDIFPKMRLYMGMDKVDVSKSKNAQILMDEGFFPAAPIISEEMWDTIQRWYRSQAPGPTNTPTRNDLIPVTLTQFKIEPPRFRHPKPRTTLVSIDEKEHALFTSDADTQSLDLLTPRCELGATFPVGNIVTTMRSTEQGFLLGCIGHFFPTEERIGQVILLEKGTNGLTRKVLFSELPRIAHIELGDFNEDGKTDFALCMFGYLTGRFSWYENLGNNQYKEHEILAKPGAIKSVAYDFNKDGHTDLAVLFGQAIDGMILFMNDGKGNFTQKIAFQKPPVWGHSSFEMADFNHDGEPDFLVTNGDNGDYESPPKPYHGIRIYLAEKGEYKEAWFYPMHGAYKALARDFDGDGDLDIAAISFFPDYEKSPRESFIYLENKGDMKFEASTFRECIAGRWLTMDAGDIDGDGDIDLALGSLIDMPTIVPPPVKEMWEKKSPSVLILKNQLKQNAPKKSAP